MSKEYVIKDSSCKSCECYFCGNEMELPLTSCECGVAEIVFHCNNCGAVSIHAHAPGKIIFGISTDIGYHIIPYRYKLVTYGPDKYIFDTLDRVDYMCVTDLDLPFIEWLLNVLNLWLDEHGYELQMSPVLLDAMEDIYSRDITPVAFCNGDF